MKIKLSGIAFSVAILSSSMVFAQTAPTTPTAPAQDGGDHFAEHKAEMVKDLNEDKASLDQVIACVNSAQKHDDMKKCNEIRKANQEKRHERRIAERKEHLQNEIKKLDAESAAPKKQ